MSKRVQKEKIRKELLYRRSRIPEQEYFDKSREIIYRLWQLAELKKARTIHCYISMNERREVNTKPLLKELISAGYEVAVPLTHMDSGVLKHVSLKDFDNLQPNAWGVLEPQGSEKISEETLGLVIVPMVGGDINRNRIGYGKGFYDRFLQKVSCPKIGLLFETCLVDKIPVEPFDVRLDKLVTERRVIS